MRSWVSSREHRRSAGGAVTEGARESYGLGLPAPQLASQGGPIGDLPLLALRGPVRTKTADTTAGASRSFPGSERLHPLVETRPLPPQVPTLSPVS